MKKLLLLATLAVAFSASAQEKEPAGCIFTTHKGQCIAVNNTSKPANCVVFITGRTASGVVRKASQRALLEPGKFTSAHVYSDYPKVDGFVAVSGQTTCEP